MPSPSAPYDNNSLVIKTHSEMARLRDGASPADQARLAPLEHRAFAREWTRENPLVAVPSLAAAIPLYTFAKALGIVKARSPASFAEVREGYRGIYEGLTIK